MVHSLNWPHDQMFPSSSRCDELAGACREAFVATCRRLHIDADLTGQLTTMYLPLAAWLIRKRSAQARPLVIGLTGGQGSGKSTVCELLKSVLRDAFDAGAGSLSIDDIYKTHQDRQRMSREVHPLFATRGVPGTHDVDLGIVAIERLKAQPADGATPLPAFDKATDDRAPESQWPVCEGAVDFIIFEGWCVGALPQPVASLSEPINELEREEDPNGVWRNIVNHALEDEYRRLFGLLDVQLMLKVDSMERVFEWRRLQEHKLKAKMVRSGADAGELKLMSDAGVDRFIMHYERITRHMLEEMPERADIVFFLDDTHGAASMRINRPL